MVNAWGIDTGGAEVTPQMGSGSVSTNFAAPSMAAGGAIPDDEETGDSSPNTDVTDYTNAMDIVRKALDYGRQQHGLPASRPQQAQDTQEQAQNSPAIPDEPESNDNSEEEGSESYAEGGTIADDIEASNDSQPDEEQYGRPEQVPVAENGEAPPISTNNTNAYPEEQTAMPQQAAGALPTGDPGDMPQQAQGALPEGDTGEIAQPNLQVGNPMGDANPAPDPQRVIGYLTGAGAMPDEQAKALEQEVSSSAAHEPNAVKLAAVQKAGEMDGPAAAFAYLQRNRQRYDATLSHAKAALTGTTERPASLSAAVKSATEAFTNLPDPTDVRFISNGMDGVVAQVRPLAGGKAQQYDLTPEQFAQITDITKDGQFDRVMAGGGIVGMLQKLTGGARGPDTSGAESGPSPFGRNPETGQAFTEGNRPSTPSESGDMARMRRNDAMAGDVANGMDSGRVLKKYGPNPVRMGGENGVLSFPGYKAYQQKYDQGRNTDGGPDTTGVGKPDNSVRMIGQGDDRTYKNGVDQTPTKQENALELIRAKNEGRGTPDDKIKVKNAEYDRRLELQAAKDKAAGERNERTDTGKSTRATQGVGSREKIAAEKLALAVKSLDATNDRSANANAVRALNGRVLATGGQNLNEPKDKALYDQITSGGQAPRAPSPQAPKAPSVAAPQAPQIPDAAVTLLKSNPSAAAQFDAKYGAGAASRILGQ